MTEDQLTLPGASPRRAARRVRGGVPAPLAESSPVARVALMVALPHLDRLFDYAVPAVLADRALPGTRVRVRLAGRLVDGFVIERVDSSEHDLAPLASVHGPPVLTPAVVDLCRSVAERYAGTLADVLRFAVPPRHARVEAAAERAKARRAGAGGAINGDLSPSALVSPAALASPSPPTQPAAPSPASPEGWARYRGGRDLLVGLADGSHTQRSLWVAGPGEVVGDRIAELVAAVHQSGRGAIVVVPDAADVERIAPALAAGGARPARLTAALGPEARYRSFLRVLAGDAPVVVGTRAAVFAPVPDLGLIVVWDDGDDSLVEPQAPGWHAREVAAMRSAATGAALVIGGAAVSLESARMVETGWLGPVQLERAQVRACMPLVRAAVDVGHASDPSAGTRLPAPVVATLRQCAQVGPVLVSVPRAGYLPALACQTCRERARCPMCSADLAASHADRVPSCGRHGPVPEWRCPICSGSDLRAVVIGVRRTAEEFGRALPGLMVITSTGQRVATNALGPRQLVVATPGAEPDPGPDGYAALVILDAEAALTRPGLRVAEEVLRRWLSVAARVRPAAQGGQVMVVGDPGLREVQALVRWDPLGHARRELAERRALHLPPAVRSALITGPAMASGELVDRVCEVLGPRLLRCSGPAPAERDDVTWLLAVALVDGAALSAAIRAQQVARSARRAAPVTVRIDPIRLP